jgi:hypothetical protein
MDDFFSYVSKGVIIVPIVIFITALIFKFNQVPKQTALSESVVILTATPTIPVKNNIKFDLVGPWICQYKHENQEYKLIVKDKKIDLEIKNSGELKKYDLSSYSPIFSSLLNIDVDQLESTAKPYLPKGVEFGTLLKSCRKGS